MVPKKESGFPDKGFRSSGLVGGIYSLYHSPFLPRFHPNTFPCDLGTSYSAPHYIVYSLCQYTIFLPILDVLLVVISPLAGRGLYSAHTPLPCERFPS